jgi:hypothetical protein
MQQDCYSLRCNRFPQFPWRTGISHSAMRIWGDSTKPERSFSQRQAANCTITARPMIRDEAGRIMPENDCEAVPEFIRTKGITRCPTACVLPTQGLVAAADRIASEEHAVARYRLRRAQAAARWRPFLTLKAPQ